MPELPEVETVVRELHAKLQNKTIDLVEVFAPKVVSIGPGTVSNVRIVRKNTVQDFKRFIEGKKIISVTRRAKMLLFHLSGEMSMLVHLKMTGQFIFEDKILRKKTGGKYRLLNKLHAPLEQLPAKHTHVVFHFTDKSTLYFNDVRKFGYLKIVQGSELSQVKELHAYGPEPLDKKFTLNQFEVIVRKRPKGNIKLVLMDSALIAGIGNIYSDEILFLAKILPTRIVSSLSKDELQSIYKWIKPVLKKGILAKGSSVGDFVRTDGSWGSMGKFHFVYGRKKMPCKVCGTSLESVKLGGRTSCFCPYCQK